MSYTYRAENKTGNVIYRWHPFRKRFQYWDVVDGNWLNSTTYPERAAGLFKPEQLMTYEDTWCEPEDLLLVGP